MDISNQIYVSFCTRTFYCFFGDGILGMLCFTASANQPALGGVRSCHPAPPVPTPLATRVTGHKKHFKTPFSGTTCQHKMNPFSRVKYPMLVHTLKFRNWHPGVPQHLTSILIPNTGDLICASPLPPSAPTPVFDASL